MGLEDRDWYREEPSKAWKRRWTSGDDRPAAQQRYRAPSGGGRGGQIVAVGGFAALFAVIAFIAWDKGWISSDGTGIPDSRVVRLHVDGLDERPAAYAGTMCVTVHGQDRVCATYRPGQKPAARLGEELRTRGYRVEFVLG